MCLETERKTSSSADSFLIVTVSPARFCYTPYHLVGISGLNLVYYHDNQVNKNTELCAGQNMY